MIWNLFWTLRPTLDIWPDWSQFLSPPKQPHKFSSQCCLSAAYLATAAHMQEPLWCCWMQNDGFYMSTMQKTITQGKQLLRSLGEWWARSLQLPSSADILFSDKMIQAGPRRSLAEFLVDSHSKHSQKHSQLCTVEKIARWGTTRKR